MSPSQTHAKGTVNVTVWLPADLRTAAQTKAAANQTTVSEVIRAALREYVEET